MHAPQLLMSLVAALFGLQMRIDLFPWTLVFHQLCRSEGIEKNLLCIKTLHTKTVYWVAHI